MANVIQNLLSKHKIPSCNTQWSLTNLHALRTLPNVLKSKERVKRDLFDCVIVPTSQVCGDVNIVLNIVCLPSEVLVQVNFHPQQNYTINTVSNKDKLKVLP